MFLRTVKVKRPGGRVDEYIRLVESVWREGRPEHRIVAHLGRKDLLAPHAATLLRMLTGDKASVSDAAHVDAVGAWDWGPCWSRGICGASWGWSRRWMPWRAIAERSPTARSRWWRVGSANPRASTGWRGGWRRPTCVIDPVSAGGPPGGTRR